MNRNGPFIPLLYVINVCKPRALLWNYWFVNTGISAEFVFAFHKIIQSVWSSSQVLLKEGFPLNEHRVLNCVQVPASRQLCLWSLPGGIQSPEAILMICFA